MASVLITGMTASQCSVRSMERSRTFALCIADVLRSNDALVQVQEPSLSINRNELEKYDSILVGIAPLLSVSANYAYATLHVLSNLVGDSRVRLFIDAPEPEKVDLSLRAVERSFSLLVKPFYSKRKNYQTATENKSVRKSMETAISFLSSSNLRMIYPSLPFVKKEDVESRLEDQRRGIIAGVNVDSFYIDQGANTPRRLIEKRWIVEKEKSKWLDSVKTSITYPHVPMKAHRRSIDSDVADRIKASTGALLGPHDDGLPWWSYRYVQALNSGTPIVTEWRHGSTIGTSWAHIAAAIEEMSEIDLYETSMRQKAEYLAAVPTREAASNELVKELGIAV